MTPSPQHGLGRGRQSVMHSNQLSSGRSLPTTSVGRALLSVHLLAVLSRAVSIGREADAFAIPTGSS